MANGRRGGRRGAFIGRRRELQAMAALIEAAREGRSGSLVLRAGAGFGKTYLLSQVIDEHAGEMQVLTISGAEAEMVFDYAGLQRLCVHLLAHVDRLPELQRRALLVAMGAESGDRPDPYLVGLAAVNLLSDAGAERLLLCVIDDAQWIDELSRQALGFAARRLQADRVVLIFATRDTDTGDHLDGLPQLKLPPLSDGESRALLDAALPGRMDHSVRERLLGEAAGNPLALLEMPRALTPAELAGGFGLADRRTPVTNLQDAFVRRFRALPEPTRLLLLIAAAEPVGEAAWLWAAAERLGVGVVDAAPAETDGLIGLDTRISFRHPLVRSAIYRSEPASQRHRVHAALADTITGPDAADYRTWHRAHATSTPDEPTAAELVESAERARSRGGIAAAAAFLKYAVDLTPDATLRARRALKAATAKLAAGDIQAATRLIETAAAASVDARHHADVALLRARLAFASDRGREGPRLLLAAARALADHEASLSRDTYLEALMAAMIVGRFAIDTDHGPEQIARAARRDLPPVASSSGLPTRTVDLLLDALITRFIDGFGAAAPLLEAAIQGYLRDMQSATADPRWHDVTNRICLDMCDFASWSTLGLKQLDMLRAAGELTVLPSALITYAAACLFDGDLFRAEALLSEEAIVSAATGAPPHRSGVALLAAHGGDELTWRSTARQTIADATSRGEGTEVAVALHANAVAHNGASRYADALRTCREAIEFPDLGLYSAILSELVEAAAYGGDHDTARLAASQLAERAAATGTPSAMGLAVRANALARGADATDADYQRAIIHLESSPLAVYRARTLLVYGEWLRRNGCDGDARVQLSLAHDLCTQMGAGGFAARAARELEAAGGSTAQTSRRRDVGLTTQERHISRLVLEGRTNAEIAAPLLISHRTVEWHLRNIYSKLGISSRRELRRLEL